MLRRLAMLVKFCATTGQLYWRRMVSSLAMRSISWPSPAASALRLNRLRLHFRQHAADIGKGELTCCSIFQTSDMLPPRRRPISEQLS